jgi:hypothetical protein
VVLVRTDITEELIASIIRVTRISELELRKQQLATEALCEEILFVTLTMEALIDWTL